MPSNVPNKPVVDFPFASIIVDTTLIERTSSFVGTYKPDEPGLKFAPSNHTAKQASDFAGKIFLGQKAGQDNEFQERIWADPPTAQDAYNYDIEFSDENIDYPIFKRRYLELRDYYTPIVKNAIFTGIYAIRLTAAGAGYKNPVVTITDGGGGTGGMAIAVLNGDGTLAKITLRVEGVNYVTPVATITDPGGPGAGATATVLLQPADCQLITEQVVQASGPWISLYHMVERVYERLDGPVRSDYVQDPQTQIATQINLQRIATPEVAPPSPVFGENISIKHINTAVSEISRKTLNSGQMDAYFAAFVGLGAIELPRVLLGVAVVWDKTVGAGSYAESGTGGTSGREYSISLNASGRGNGSASVLPELIPTWAARPYGQLEVVDFYFFLPANPTVTAILTKASAVATLFFGGATTISAWPVFQPIEHTFVLAGQKVSLSSEASARASVSSGTSGASIAQSSGIGGNLDFGQSLRPVTLPECIHDAISLSGGATNSQAAATASAVNLVGSGDWPTLTPSASLSSSAVGFVTPSTLAATSPVDIPATGRSAERFNVETFQDGYCAVRVRTFDFGQL